MAFRSKLKIRFGDIDRAGIVYYPRFMHYFHVAMEEFFAAELGVEYPTVIDTHRIGLPTVHLESDFSRPFSYGDTLEVEVRIIKLGRTSVTFGYRVFKEGEVDPRIIGRNVAVCLDMDNFQKMEFPSWLRQLFEEQIDRPLE